MKYWLSGKDVDILVNDYYFFKALTGARSINKKKINMLTDGQEVRDFLYAEDCCIGLEKIMLKYKEIKRLKKSIKKRISGYCGNYRYCFRSLYYTRS